MALFALTLDELVDQDAVVRVIDAWVDSLDLVRLGFERAVAARTGRPPYHPGDLLKLYLYGYLGAVRSSRRLERECQRNVEVMWMLGRLAPDHKTIAEFRRTQGAALVATAAAFVQFARRHKLVAAGSVAIDGTKLRAVASRKAVVGLRSLDEELRLIGERVAGYLRELDANDGSDDEAARARSGAVRDLLGALHEEQARVEQQIQTLKQANRSTNVTTEPDARLMKSLNGAPGYNLQTAVDTHSHLIVHHEVVSDTSDQTQLASMAEGAARSLEAKRLEVLADSGYSNAEQIHQLREVGMEVVLPVTRSANSHDSLGELYTRADFRYDAVTDTYRCPADQLLTRRSKSDRDKLFLYSTHSRTCERCQQRDHCTKSKRRWITRSFHEQDLEATQALLAERPGAMRRRRSTVEHPFGTIKEHILGNARLLMRGLPGANAELSLAVLAYNLKRAINCKGIHWMMEASAT